MATYGTDYEINSVCPLCGMEHKSEINMEELDVRTFDEDMLPLFDIELPVSKHRIKLTLQTPRMLDTTTKNVKRFMKRHVGANNPTLIYSICDSIIELDDEPVINRVKLEKLVEDLPMKDTNALIKRIDTLNSYIGVDTSVSVTCPICGHEYIIPFQINNKFWRPD